MRVYIRLDTQVDMYESFGYSLATMLSEIGGLASIVYAFAQILVFFVARNWFIGSLIQIMFRSDNLTERAQDEEFDDPIDTRQDDNSKPIG